VTHKQEHIVAVVLALGETDMFIDAYHEDRGSVQDLVALDHEGLHGGSYDRAVLITGEDNT